jgi:hypothetical protein
LGIDFIICFTCVVLWVGVVDNNNQDYAKVDKSKGEDFLFITATAAAAAYAAFVGDGDLSFFNALYNLTSSPSRHNHR